MTSTKPMNCLEIRLRWWSYSAILRNFSLSNAFKMRCTACHCFTANCAQKFFSSQLDGIDGLGPKAESHEAFQVSDKNQESQWMRLSSWSLDVAEAVQRKLNLQKLWNWLRWRKKSRLPNGRKTS